MQDWRMNVNCVKYDQNGNRNEGVDFTKSVWHSIFTMQLAREDHCVYRHCISIPYTKNCIFQQNFRNDVFMFQ